MPIVGVICGADGTYQSFEQCIDCHINRHPKLRKCQVPVQSIKSMRDNHLHRVGAGISASTIISCPRAIAIEEKYDVYESVMSGWNKFRGNLTHFLMECDPDPPPWVIRERRLYREILNTRVTGKPDEIDTKFFVLTDYKSKDNIPLSREGIKKPDPRHELQFNIYAWLLRGGHWSDTNEKANIDIKVIGAHYVTNKTKLDKAFLKMQYPVWSDDRVTALIEERLPALTNWRDYGILPACSPYVSGNWDCDCVKYEKQLAERGTIL